MSNSTRAKVRRTKRNHMSKHQRDIMTSQHFGNERGQYNAEIRGRGDNKISRLIEEVVNAQDK